ncbi:carbohydrate ABC transporter permease [Dictyobacter formicarum]|uniref:Sugar ABC transporter permease n=1 Tax=Dictyobacter formicarum TaxID=2778368 RepID=A0ABQ3VW69_9CHLR|nr:carbohydrate ABC transporter permease [Dictyobacter formicarum]GHO89813.1 sugar ABC transporter permease [Dictyobacter formicarum]
MNMRALSILRSDQKRPAFGADQVLRTITFIVLVILSCILLFPLAWMLSTSLKLPSDVFTIPIQWFPHPIAWDNYAHAVQDFPFWAFLGNTLFYCISDTILVVASSAISAYAFARLRWRGREVVFVIMLATMMIPFPATMIPTYLIFKWLGWLNSFKPLILPDLTASPFYVFLLRQFFMTIPNELSEAAFVDGASHLRVFWQIMLPLAKPALLVVAIFTFTSDWNNFLGPLIYLNDQSKYTLALGLQWFQGSQWHGAHYELMMAAALLMTLPMVVLFFVAQKYFVQGITMTGSKG